MTNDKESTMDDLPPVNPIQAMVDAMSRKWQQERSTSQLTLGKLIAALEKMAPESLVRGLVNPHSYRGYYSDLAFEPQAESVTAAALLADCRNAMGRVFQGYKGGDYVMGETTPMWVSDYGCCGLKLMSMNPDGTIETATDD